MSRYHIALLACAAFSAALIAAWKSADSAENGPYQIAASGDAGLSAWRLDTRSGEMAFCQMQGGQVTCVTEKRK